MLVCFPVSNLYCTNDKCICVTIIALHTNCCTEFECFCSNLVTSVDGNVTQRNGPARLQNAFAFVFVIASSSSSSSRLASFDRSTMTDAEVIWISSDDESDYETVCDDIEYYYSLGENDLVDASMDIRYDLEWAFGAWLDYTWNQELMELFGEFDDGN